MSNKYLFGLIGTSTSIGRKNAGTYLVQAIVTLLIVNSITIVDALPKMPQSRAEMAMNAVIGYFRLPFAAMTSEAIEHNCTCFNV